MTNGIDLASIAEPDLALDLAFTFVSPELRAAVLAHYEHAAEPIALNFPHVPVVAANYPNGIDHQPTYTASWHKPLPQTVPFAEVGPAGARKRYAAIDRNALLWLVHRGAVGFESWTPSSGDPERVGHARILLSARGGADHHQLADALLAVRAELARRGARAIPVLDGRDGAALFVPLADEPEYEPVRTWLHAVANAAAAGNPALLTTETHPSAPRVHLAVSSNVVGRFSSLPYTLAGTPTLPMVTPLDWSEVGSVHNGAFTAANGAARIAQGDCFARESAAIGPQAFAAFTA
jgi:DNA primase